MKIKLLKYLLMSMAILLPATSIYADNLSVEPFALRPGESHVVTVNMSNSKNYTAFQVDITLPDNVEILEQNHEYVVLSERASNSHSIKINLTEGNKVKIICFSEDNTPFANDNGPLFSFLVKAKDNFNGGDICLKNIIFSDASNKDTEFPDATTLISKITQIESIVLNHTSIEMRAGETVRMTATVSPQNATNKDVIWTVDNKDVATIDSNGNVTAIAVGNATITATAADASGVMAKCAVCVLETKVESITLNHTSIEMRAGETVRMTATVSPQNATNKDVTWTVDNKDVATIDSNGNVTAIAVGNATITATAADASGVMAKCTVSVPETTGVNDVVANSNKKHVIYSITGFRLSCDFKDLPSGIYIVDNKKVVKK